MEDITPSLYIIGGANGSGKTTSALKILPSYLECFEYVNADSIASALSPFKPESVAIKAGRLMLERIQELLSIRVNFAFETTLASRSFISLLKRAKEEFNYSVHLLYFWLESEELAIGRVKERVRKGGHNIPEEIIRRRYKKSLKNLNELYLPVVDSWFAYDNSGTFPIEVAEGGKEQETLIYNVDTWSEIQGK